MELTKKFISPGRWFAMNYPADWHEAEAGEGAFLFYNPEVWNGDFMISAYRGAAHYGQEVVEQEKAAQKDAQMVHLGKHVCVYSTKRFTHQNHELVTHFWVFGVENIAFECSFTAFPTQSTRVAEQVVASIKEIDSSESDSLREVIEIRLSEILQLDEAYERIAQTVKNHLGTEYQGTEASIVRLQKLLDEGMVNPKKRKMCADLGMALCLIFSSSYPDRVHWCTLIDGVREVPLLLANGAEIDPSTLILPQGEVPQLQMIYDKLLSHL